MCHLVYLGPETLAHNLVIPVLAYFCGVAILSFKSRYGDDVWEMVLKKPIWAWIISHCLLIDLRTRYPNSCAAGANNKCNSL